MSTAGEVRIGDAERDRAVSALGEHYAAGRITKDEFDERSDQATRARYAAELAPLFADLPVQTGAVEQRPARRPGPPPPFVFLVPVVVVALVVTAVAAAPWLVWMLFAMALFMGPWGGRHHGRRGQHWHHGRTYHHH